MENHNSNYNNTRNQKPYENKAFNTNWIIAGLVALAVVFALAYYNNDNAQDLQNIAPAAGSSVDGTTQVPQRNMENR